MRTVQILEGNDCVQPDDWMRPLCIISMGGGHSDYYDFTPTENNAKWQRVKYILGKPWHGCTVQEIDKEFKEFNHYEFVRGDIPSSHRESTKGLIDYSKHAVPDRDEDDIPF